jgi:putative transposase
MRKSILICDDEPLIRMNLKSMVVDLGFDEILECENGANAVELALASFPDIAIMDVSMPGMDSVWDCKYHVVWIPKCRRKVLYGRNRKDLSEYLHELARQKECKILEGHLCPDHIHMLISIPPKYSVAQVMGFIKGKSAIHVARTYCESACNNDPLLA